MRAPNPFLYLAMAAASLLVPILWMIAEPYNATAFVALLPGMGLAVLFGWVFFDRFYIVEIPPPAVHMAVEYDYFPSRVKCGYCGTLQPPGEKCVSCGAALPETKSEERRDEAFEEFRKEA